MSIRITVGICRDSDQASSSISAAGELDPSLLEDPAALQQHMAELFTQVHTALLRQIKAEESAQVRSRLT